MPRIREPFSVVGGTDGKHMLLQLVQVLRPRIQAERELPLLFTLFLELGELPQHFIKGAGPLSRILLCGHGIILLLDESVHGVTHLRPQLLKFVHSLLHFTLL